jgi:hypothetical protein
MQSAREILDQGQLREVVRLAIELSEARERLEALIRRGVCPHCGAKVFEDPAYAQIRK